MTPREELLRDFDALVDNYHASRQETRAMLNQYAIGRWVSVEERLPDDFGSYMTDLGCAYYDPTSKDFSHPYVTKWMDLDLPIGKEVER